MELITLFYVKNILLRYFTLKREFILKHFALEKKNGI